MMIRRLTPLALGGVAVLLASCTSGRDADPQPTPAPTTSTPAPASTPAPGTVTTAGASTSSGPALITAPATTAPVPLRAGPDTTVRVGVFAAEGGDGLGDDEGDGARYPAFDAIDISPLPAAITDEQGRTDPAAVARQWAGLKVLTSQIMDGPLWPYSVGRHLPALSDPAGQFIAEGRLQRVEVLDQSQPDSQTALVTVAVDADNPSGETLSIVYAIELWRGDDGHWLVAFADLTAG